MQFYSFHSALHRPIHQLCLFELSVHFDQAKLHTFFIDWKKDTKKLVEGSVTVTV